MLRPRRGPEPDTGQQMMHATGLALSTNAVEWLGHWRRQAARNPAVPRQRSLTDSRQQQVPIEPQDAPPTGSQGSYCNASKANVILHQ